MSDIVDAGGAAAAGSGRSCLLPDDLRTALDDITTGLGKACGVEPWRLTDAQVGAVFGELLAVRARVEALTGRMLSLVEQRDIARSTTGASSVHPWLRDVHGLSRQDSGRLVRESRVFGTGPDAKTCQAVAEQAARVAPTTDAWLNGVVNAEQATLIAGTVAKIDATLSDRRVHALQDDLVDHATTLSYDELVRVCRHAVEVVDPDGADARLAEQLEADEARALAETTLTFGPNVAGVVSFTGKLPAFQADIWRTHLEAFTAPRHQTSTGASFWTGKQTPDDRIVDDVESQGHNLTYGQRLGRAHCDLLEHLPTDGLPQHGVTNATIVLTIDHTDLTHRVGEAMLDTGTVVSPGQTRRLACNAQLLPAVLDGPSRILDLGTSQRLFDRTQRLALHLRDKGCIFPGCDKVPAWCEAHHITPWSAGGPTNLTNGCLLCPFHHHLIHTTTGQDAGWTIQINPDGTPEVQPPTHIDPQRTPRRHHRFRHRQRQPPARGPSPPN